MFSYEDAPNVWSFFLQKIRIFPAESRFCPKEEETFRDFPKIDFGIRFEKQDTRTLLDDKIVLKVFCSVLQFGTIGESLCFRFVQVVVGFCHQISFADAFGQKF